MSRHGVPLYKPNEVHVVRYYRGSEARTISGSFSFKFLKGRIEKLHGKEAASTAVSWGWQTHPITY